MTIQEVAAKYSEYQIEMRRYFHENPELSYKEFNTSSKVKEELDKMNIPWRVCGSETGILATITGKKPGKTILLRGDMDALEVKEETGLPYASKTEGVLQLLNGHDSSSGDEAPPLFGKGLFRAFSPNATVFRFSFYQNVFRKSSGALKKLPLRNAPP